jgi:hypothetical protein
MVNNYKRHGKKWTHNEVLALQREYELLEWTVEEIAAKHGRTISSIIYKLYSEDITSELYEARMDDVKLINNNESKIEDKISVQEHFNTDVSVLSDRVWSLETSINKISSMVKQMFVNFTNKNKKNTLLENTVL